MQLCKAEYRRIDVLRIAPELFAPVDQESELEGCGFSKVRQGRLPSFLRLASGGWLMAPHQGRRVGRPHFGRHLLLKFALVFFVLRLHLIHEFDELGRLSDTVQVGVTLKPVIALKPCSGSLS